MITWTPELAAEKLAPLGYRRIYHGSHKGLRVAFGRGSRWGLVPVDVDDDGLMPHHVAFTAFDTAALIEWARESPLNGAAEPVDEEGYEPVDDDGEPDVDLPPEKPKEKPKPAPAPKAEEPVKRKRGRPRKVKPVDVKPAARVDAGHVDISDGPVYEPIAEPVTIESRKAGDTADVLAEVIRRAMPVVSEQYLRELIRQEIRALLGRA